MAYGLSNTTTSNLSTSVANLTVSPLATDGATGQKEYSWQNNNWNKYWGFFNDPDLGELKSAFVMKSIWNTGKGYTADPETTVILDHISGWGKDTFKDVLFNMDLISRLGGDSYAEIIRDKKTGLLLNLKILDPGSIKIVVDEKGILIRYEQVSKISGNPIIFQPDEIFHLSHNRLADQIHGISDIVALENTILSEKESFVDTRKIMHRQARPMIVFKLGTDDPTKISAFAAKMDQAVSKGENIYVPNDTNTFEYEVVKIDLNNMLMQWRDSIKQKFYTSLGLPASIFGGGAGTESQSKINYLAHEQVFSHDQKFLEEQIWNQLYLRIKLISPVTLLENLRTDESKDGNQGMEIQPNDVTAGSGQ